MSRKQEKKQKNNKKKEEKKQQQQQQKDIKYETKKKTSALRIYYEKRWVLEDGIHTELIEYHLKYKEGRCIQEHESEALRRQSCLRVPLRKK